MAALPVTRAIPTDDNDDTQHLQEETSEQEPFIVEPDTPLHPEDAHMGYDEQFVKPEGRQGDVVAQWAAYVRLDHHIFFSVSPSDRSAFLLAS